MPKGMPLRDRVLSRLVITEPPMTHDRLGRPLIGPCLLWPSHGKDGYAMTKVAGRGRVVHRVVYEMFVGPISNQLDHLCRVRHCASPSHLEDVTGGENIRRGDTGRMERERTHCAQGHEYNDANTVRRGKKRECRLCQLASSRRRGGVPADAPLRQDRPCCKNGHLWDAQNTIHLVAKSGPYRRCRACHNSYRRKLSHRGREARGQLPRRSSSAPRK